MGVCVCASGRLQSQRRRQAQRHSKKGVVAGRQLRRRLSSSARDLASLDVACPNVSAKSAAILAISLALSLAWFIVVLAASMFANIMLFAILVVAIVASAKLPAILVYRSAMA